MNLLRSTSILFVLIIGFLPPSVFALSPDQVFEKVKKCVVVVKTYDSSERLIGQGSGVVLASGEVVTNCHVLENGTHYTVGYGNDLRSAVRTTGDNNKDLCLLKSEALQAKPAHLSKNRRLKVGEPVYAVGSPQGLELSISDGIVSQLRGSDPPIIQTTAAISPGSSGGGLFNAEGELVGITSFSLADGQNLNFALPVEWVTSIGLVGKEEVKEKEKLGQRTIQDWLARIYALEKKRDWLGLLSWTEEWTRAQSKEAIAWYALGFAYGVLAEKENTVFSDSPDYGRHHYEKAVEAYREAVRLEPNFTEAWSALGASFYSLGRHEAAISAYRNALHLDPNDANAWRKLASSYKILGRFEQSIGAYREALRLKSDHPFAEYTWYEFGIVSAKLGRYEQAIEAYREAVRLEPRFVEAWDALATAYNVIGNREQALVAKKNARCRGILVPKQGC